MDSVHDQVCEPSDSTCLSQLTIEFRLIALHRQIDLPTLVYHVEVVSEQYRFKNTADIFLH